MASVKIWMEIAAGRLEHNYTTLKRIVAQASGETATPPAVLAVVKANAYGHGIDPCAAILAAAGAEWLGVTDAPEGAAVRQVLTAAAVPEASQPRILVMTGTAALPGEAALILRHRLTPVVWSSRHIALIATAARTAGCNTPIDVHLEIDSGMSRQGVPPGPALDATLALIAREPLIALDGVLTHFASTEVAVPPQDQPDGTNQTAAQQAQFEAALAQIAASGLRPRWVHVGNSSYIDNSQASDHPLRWLHSLATRLQARALVRSGLALYGYALPIEGDSDSVEPLARPHLLPILAWKTRIIAISEVPPGAAIGYNATWIARTPTRLALLPVGYADGLRRELSSSNTAPGETIPGSASPGGWVIIRGRRAPILGRVSMNLTTVDISAIPEAAEGDEAVLLGDNITADDHARLARTIAYEILCALRSSP